MPSTSASDHSSDRFSTIRPEYAESATSLALAQGRITSDDADLIAAFLCERRATAGIGVGRSNKIAFTLISWRRFLPPFKQITMPTIFMGIEALKKANSQFGRPFKQNTIADHVVVLKMFVPWLIENGIVSLPLQKIKSIRTPEKNYLTKGPKDVFSHEEIAAMIAATIKSRDRALISILYEGGFRVGEIGTMRWGDISVTDYGGSAIVQFKTKMIRHVPIQLYWKHLMAWKADYWGPHPHDDDLVFVSERKRGMTHAGIAKMLNIVAKRAGINRRITPHQFRHTRTNHMIQQGVPETIIKKIMWGTTSTTMFRTYEHVTGGDIDRVMARTHKIATPDLTTKHLEPITCPHCFSILPPGVRACDTCGEPVSGPGRVSQQAIQQFIFNNMDTFEQYLQEVKESGLSNPPRNI